MQSLLANFDKFRQRDHQASKIGVISFRPNTPEESRKHAQKESLTFSTMPVSSSSQHFGASGRSLDDIVVVVVAATSDEDDSLLAHSRRSEKSFCSSMDDFLDGSDFLNSTTSLFRQTSADSAAGAQSTGSTGFPAGFDATISQRDVAESAKELEELRSLVSNLEALCLLESSAVITAASERRLNQEYETISRMRRHIQSNSKSQGSLDDVFESDSEEDRLARSPPQLPNPPRSRERSVCETQKVGREPSRRGSTHHQKRIDLVSELSFTIRSRAKTRRSTHPDKQRAMASSSESLPISSSEQSPWPAGFLNPTSQPLERIDRAAMGRERRRKPRRMPRALSIPGASVFSPSVSRAGGNSSNRSYGHRSAETLKSGYYRNKEVAILSEPSDDVLNISQRSVMALERARTHRSFRSLDYKRSPRKNTAPLVRPWSDPNAELRDQFRDLEERSVNSIKTKISQSGLSVKGVLVNSIDLAQAMLSSSTAFDSFDSFKSSMLSLSLHNMGLNTDFAAEEQCTNPRDNNKSFS
jgi:hypothetical protein